MDRVDRKRRSWNMSRIKGRDTAPELAVRSILHAHGLRFRLHGRGLPGRPDIVLPKYRVAVFVHGCFWHRHPRCKYAYSPKTRKGFWQGKFQANVRRDAAAVRALKKLGWRPIIVWECEVAHSDRILRKVTRLIPSLH
jgi:DNA mismatch endonuclease (patch repair protein)